MEQLTPSSGTMKVFCDKNLYGDRFLVVDYILYQNHGEFFFHELKLVQENYRQMYDDFLGQLFIIYSKIGKCEIWDEASQGLIKIPIEKKEDLHPYLGEPVIEIMNRSGHPVIGLSFYKNNLLSLEHGLCAVFESLQLLMINADDFSNMVYYWDASMEFNMMKY